MAEVSSTSILDISVIGNGNRKLAPSLKEALDTVIKKTIRNFKFSMLKNSYIEIFNNNPETLRKLHEDVVTQLRENVKLEISKMCEDENIERLLDSLDDISLQNAENVGQVAWRPTGNPCEDLRDHLYEAKLKQKEELEKILEELTEENETLSNVVEKNYSDIVQMKSENEKLIGDLKESINLLEDSAVDNEQIANSIPFLHKD